MNIVDISIKRPVMITMLLFAFALFGSMAFFTLPMSFFPNVSLPFVSIQTVYPGSGPDIVESQITKIIEDQVSAISGVDSIISYSMDSLSFIHISFKYGTDENIALQHVKDKIDAVISEFPDDAEKPLISKVDITNAIPVMNIIVEGTMDERELYTYSNTIIKDRLSQVSGVGKIELYGGVEREIRIEMDSREIFSKGIQPLHVAEVLRTANTNIPGGNIQYTGQDIPVRFDSEFQSIKELENIDVPTEKGIFKLRQIADIRDGRKTSREKITCFNNINKKRNNSALLLEVVKNPSANTVTVVRDSEKTIREIEEFSDGKIRMTVISEDATFVEDSVKDTISNIILGILLTGLVLFFFLHDLRSTLIVAVAMPFSIISTFLIMKSINLSLNVVSLMGLSSATGTLVANSVVVIENIFRHKERGHSRSVAASNGTKEVIMAVFASTLTNIAVFIPLANVSSIVGSALGNFAYTIVIATVFSIFVSVTLTPLMASRILPETRKKEWRINSFLESMFRKWENYYRNLLSEILKTRKTCAITTAFIIFLFLLSLFAAKNLKFELFPQSDGGKIQINVELAAGADISSTEKLLSGIEKRLESIDEIEIIQTTIGSMGMLDKDVNLARINVFLVPLNRRNRSSKIIASGMIQLLSDIPGADIKVSAVSEIQAGFSTPIDLNLTGDNRIRETAIEVKKTIEKIPGISNLAMTEKDPKPELVIKPDRRKISQNGLSPYAIALSVRSAVEGFTATTLKEDGDEFDIRVSINNTENWNPDDIKNIPVVSSRGIYPLSHYAEVGFKNTSTKLMRVDKNRNVQYTADVLPGYAAGNVMSEIMKSTALMDLPPGYKIQPGMNTEMMNDTIKDLATVFIVAIILVYMLLAAVLESLTQPLFIISTVPLSIIGVVTASLLTGTVINGVAMLGIIMLVGIVVNNAILILDFYNSLRKKGKEAKEALLEACPLKLKPILMSNIAIVLGMLPMAMGIGASGAEIRQPMGVVVIGGILSAMLLTLFLLPSLEYLLSKRKTNSTKKTIENLSPPEIITISLNFIAGF